MTVIIVRRTQDNVNVRVICERWLLAYNIRLIADAKHGLGQQSIESQQLQQ